MNKDLNDVSHRLVFSLLGGEYTLRKDSIPFDSLSKDWILKLDPNDNFGN